MDKIELLGWAIMLGLSYLVYKFTSWKMWISLAIILYFLGGKDWLDKYGQNFGCSALPPGQRQEVRHER